MTKMSSLKKIAAAMALVIITTGCAFAAPAPRPMHAPHNGPAAHAPAHHNGHGAPHGAAHHRAPAPRR